MIQTNAARLFLYVLITRYNFTMECRKMCRKLQKVMAIGYKACFFLIDGHICVNVHCSRNT